MDRLHLVVEIWLRDGDVAAFEALERAFAIRMRAHGGAIERAVRLAPRDERVDGDAPFEIHVVTFPDADAFAAYRADPAVQALAADRERVIGRTVIRGGHGVSY